MAGTIDSAPDRSPRRPVLAIVAAHDEADRIGATLGALGEAFPGAELWVADDGSSDRTGQLAREAGARVVGGERVIGKGGAVTRAVREALAGGRGGEDSLFILCDGDLGESAGELGPLADLVGSGEADVAVAAFSRRVGGGFGIALGFARWAIRRRCGLLTTAPISGQRALTRDALEAALPLAAGYGMEVGMTIDAVRAGMRVSEVELDLFHRASGRNLAGFMHRGRQLMDIARVYLSRRQARGRHASRA